MTFLAILVALALERALHAAELEHLRQGNWFAAYRDAMLARIDRLPGGDGPLGVALICLIPAVLVWGIIWFFAQYSTVLAFVFSVGVLLYCLGPRELLSQLKDYVDAHGDNEAQAGTGEETARAIAGDLMESEPALGPEEDPHRAVTEAALVRANDRLFAVLFWFAVAGPAGAALYRGAHLNARNTFADPGEGGYTGVASTFEGLMAWLPARILALTYALTGSFEEAMADWKAYYEECTDPFFETSQAILSCAGCGAMRISAGSHEAGLAEVRGVRSLLKRSLLLWLALLAVLTLVGLT